MWIETKSHPMRYRDTSIKGVKARLLTQQLRKDRLKKEKLAFRQPSKDSSSGIKANSIPELPAE